MAIMSKKNVWKIREIRGGWSGRGRWSGVTVQASTLGALEALLEFLKNPGKDRQGKERPPIPVSSATVGPIHKKDVLRAAIMAQKGRDEYSCILGFDVPVDPEAQA